MKNVLFFLFLLGCSNQSDKAEQVLGSKLAFKECALDYLQIDHVEKDVIAACKQELEAYRHQILDSGVPEKSANIQVLKLQRSLGIIQ